MRIFFSRNNNTSVSRYFRLKLNDESCATYTSVLWILTSMQMTSLHTLQLRWMLWLRDTVHLSSLTRRVVVMVILLLQVSFAASPLRISKQVMHVLWPTPFYVPCLIYWKWFWASFLFFPCTSSICRGLQMQKSINKYW